MTATVAGKHVDFPFDRVAAYAEKYAGTIRHYDLAGQGAPSVLTTEEIQRTRKIASRISNRELAWMLARASDAPWNDVPGGAELYDADPSEEGGLYDRADALYRHFQMAAPRGIDIAKVSKTLHIKRPALVPILDSHLVAAYRRQARAAALHFSSRGHRRMYWEAIRRDLLANREVIAELKQQLASDDRDHVRRAAQLSDLRVLDILCWAAS